ncbi:hypothetical protein EX30DRAFT_345896 [Ascodesmis nigricans]|uniref:S-adenosyl-L-methionine-dependent methyltransferase n=1 Tax=Ascodesmis nigricans TaxID=341454 RepID=A0A4S2N7Z3_9PEZI|nr:hypothetical protein EX30DRAFT_345896 [Ascodesmis nigricans]
MRHQTLLTFVFAQGFGDEHPGSKIVGVDLAPIQSTWVAPNKEWTFPKNHFNLIHPRTVRAGVKDWGRYMTQMYEHCTPDGYVEISEAGFVDVKEYVFKFPSEDWVKKGKLRRLRAITAVTSISGFEAYGKSLMTYYGGMSDEEATKLIGECQEIVRSCTQHIYNFQFHLVARKLESGSKA